MTDNPESDLICLFCGDKTSIDEPIEHIFPKSIGGDVTLPRGDVCQGCNNHLSRLEKSLKSSNPVMAASFQMDDFQTGRKNSSGRRQRHNEEKKHIVGNGFEIKYDKEKNHMNATNISVSIYNDDFVRTLHKFAIELVCKEIGSKATRAKYGEIIDFVMNGTDAHSWSYAVSYRKAGLFGIWFVKPHKLSDITSNGTLVSVCIIHTSGLYLIGLKKNAINTKLIHDVSHHTLTSTDGYYHERVRKVGVNFDYAYDSRTWPGNLRAIGALNFIWIKKHFKPKQIDEYLHLLTRCKICGQVNNVGLGVPRDLILNEKNTISMIMSESDSWNRYVVEDLVRLGYKVDNMNKLRIDDLLSQPMQYSTKNMALFTSKIDSGVIRSCMCCGNPILWAKKDLFL